METNTDGRFSAKAVAMVLKTLLPCFRGLYTKIHKTYKLNVKKRNDTGKSYLVRVDVPQHP